MAMLFIAALGTSAFAQSESLFEAQAAAEHAQHQEEQERGPLTAEQKAAGMRESIF
jgi:hypothetical protein